MSIAIECPRCRHAYNLDDALGGKVVKCRACGSAIEVPAGDLEVLQVMESEKERTMLPRPSTSTGSAKTRVGMRTVRCPACKAVFAEGTVICTLCGMNFQTGQKEPVQNFLDPGGGGDGTVGTRRWFRRRGSATLELADSLLRVGLVLFAAAGVAVWVWRLYQVRGGLTVTSLLPVALVTLLLAGVIGPVAAWAVNHAVKLMGFIPRQDTYWRTSLAVLVPFAGAMAAQYPGMERQLAWIVTGSWLAGAVLLAYLLRAEVVEWMVSVATAMAAIVLVWLVLAGIMAVVGSRAPLYPQDLPGLPWTTFTPALNPGEKAPQEPPAATQR